MEGTQYISYAQWEALVDAVREKGIRSREFEQIQAVYPQMGGDACVPLVRGQLQKLEEHLLRQGFRLFQRDINRCLEEADLESAQAAINNLKRHVQACLFFRGIPEYPESVKDGMEREIRRCTEEFCQEFLQYMGRLERENDSGFVQELVYICRKRMAKWRRQAGGEQENG